MEKNKESSNIQTLAVVEYLSQEAGQVADLDDIQVMIYDTQLDCLNAVKDKKADAALCDGYLAEYQLSAEMRYHNMEIRRVLSQEHGVSMTVHSSNPELAGILNKTLMSIDARAVSDYMMERLFHDQRGPVCGGQQRTHHYDSPPAAGCGDFGDGTYPPGHQKDPEADV